MSCCDSGPARGLSRGPRRSRRLPEVVCVLLDGAGEIVGVNSVYPQDLALIGGRRFWVYRSFLLRAASSAGLGDDPTPRSRHSEAEFEPRAPGPIGLCVRRRSSRDGDAVRRLSGPRRSSSYAGYLDDDRQVRIRYFEGAPIGPASRTPPP